MPIEPWPALFSEPSFRFSRSPKRSPSLHFARVRRAGVVEGLSCYLPMRFVSIGKPHIHHERISVVGAFNPISTRLWFQSHRDKSHFPNRPMVAKNLRLEGTSALRSGRRSRIAPGTQSKRSGFVPRSTQSLPPGSTFNRTRLQSRERVHGFVIGTSRLRGGGSKPKRTSGHF